MPLINRGLQFWKCSEELLLDYLNGRCGGRATITYIPSADDAPPVLAASYLEYPAAGYLTAFTVGMSSVPSDLPDGVRCELMISVRSSNAAWARALGVIAARYRGQGGFTVGDTVSVSDDISRSSPMRSFLVHNPSLLELAGETLKLEDRSVRLLQLYPVHEAEIDLIRRFGHQAFVDARPALADTTRPALTEGDLGAATRRAG